MRGDAIGQWHSGLRACGAALALHQAADTSEKLGEALFFLRVGWLRLVWEILDESFEVLVLVDDFVQLKYRTPLRKNVHAAVVVILEFLDDFCRAANFSQVFLARENHAEFAFFGEAEADHLAVAWLEDVERQGHAGQQDDFEREERDTRGPHGVQWVRCGDQRKRESAACISSRACMSPAF